MSVENPINKSLPIVTMWMDRNIETLSRDELLEVVQYLGHKIKEQQKAHEQTLRIWEMYRKIKG